MPGSGLLGGRYRLEEPPIGEGGMGVVYRAVDIGVGNRKVAVKTISGPVDRASVEQFRKEWDVLADLCHANIVNVYDVGEFAGKEGKKPFFVMPLLRGSDLGRLLQPPGSRLDAERLVGIVSQVCKGLQSAHNRGIVHRDLKPSNIFLLEDDTVILIDFGLVHLVSNNSVVGIKGTLPYMAPEQLDGKATPQSDIFSVGVVCYEALTGRRPFTGETPPQLMDSIRSHNPPPISDLNPAVPFPLAQVVHRALAKQPYGRFSSAKELSYLLQRALDGEPIPELDPVKIEGRLNRIRKSLSQGDAQYAKELIDDLQAEGHIESELSILRIQIEEASRNRLIEQLLDGARIRIDEQDYPLAEEKIQSVLDLDPTNIDALALKREVSARRSTAGVQRWYQIACQHRDRKLYAKAREAIGEVLKLDPNHGPAAELLAEVKRGEKEQGRLQDELQRLYQSARKAYGSGEISTALNKLERILELSKGVSGHTQTTGEYERLYNQVRLERDQLRAAYAEARAALEAKNLRRAQDICKQVLDRRPRDALFKALLIEVDSLERQIRSASIAEMHSLIEAEADLETKFELARKAVKLFEDEQTFAEAFRLIREKRDLVNTIARRAREYESQSQFVEARNQWQVLKDIYPQFPGLPHEVSRLELKLQETWQEQSRSELSQRAAVAGSSAAYEYPAQSARAATDKYADPREERLRDERDEVVAKGLSRPEPGRLQWSHGNEISDLHAPLRSEPTSDPQLWKSLVSSGEPISQYFHSSVSRFTQADNLHRDGGFGVGDASNGLEDKLHVFANRKFMIVGVGVFALMLTVVFASLTRFSRAPQSPLKTKSPVAAGGAVSWEPASSSAGKDNRASTNADSNLPGPSFSLPHQKLNEVRLRSDPEHAQVRADRNVGVQCDTPCSLGLANGTHTLVFTSPNRETVSKNISVPAPDEVFVAMPYATAAVKVISNPAGLEVSIDGKPRGETPLEVRLTVGPHQLTVIRDGLTHNETIQVDREEEGLKIVTIDLTGSTGLPAGT